MNVPGNLTASILHGKIGTCLTVTEMNTAKDSFKVGVSPETLRKTSLGVLSELRPLIEYYEFMKTLCSSRCRISQERKSSESRARHVSFVSLWRSRCSGNFVAHYSVPY